jgi:rRNA maturation endonuclease Nob1
MTPQGWLTAGVALLTITITMTFFYVTIAKTPKHGFLCTRCGKELPANAGRCANCGTEIANADQLL